MSYGSVIAAISTPSGKGGVALIRISGDGAIEIADKVFKPRSKLSLTDLPPRTQVRGDILYRGEHIDDGMATVFRSPSSYTGEDTVEITCHGGILLTERVLESVLLAGAKLAERGEFTERAFINGKISLSDAESIGNLLEARSDEQIRLASAESRDMLNKEIDRIRAKITALLASLFARIDYPDEDLGDFTGDEALERLNEISDSISALTKTYSTARAINEGIDTVICGKPNVGKSSLYNALIGEDAAIVTDIEGTTRDILSRDISIGRVMLRLSDTAGLREKSKADAVEKIGIERTRKAIEKSELIIAVFDGSAAADSEDMTLISILSEIKTPKIAVINKNDLQSGFDSRLVSDFDYTVSLSAREEGAKARAELSEIVDRLFTDERLICGRDALISSARQNAALISAGEYIAAATAAFSSGVLTDAASSEIELALGAISEIDGKAVVDSVLDEIFSKFCVGK